MIIGVTLIIIGSIFLLQELGILGGDFWSVFWPVAMIVLGFILLRRGKGESHCKSWNCIDPASCANCKAERDKLK